MKTLILTILFLITSNLLAAEPTCTKIGLEIEGQYGKHKSPLLKIYSEASGNLESLEIKSKQQFEKLDFVFIQENEVAENPISLKLNNNKTKAFNFNKVLKTFKTRPSKLTIKVYKENNKTTCSEDVEIIQRDGQDGVLKKI